MQPGIGGGPVVTDIKPPVEHGGSAANFQNPAAEPGGNNGKMVPPSNEAASPEVPIPINTEDKGSDRPVTEITPELPTNIAEEAGRDAASAEPSSVQVATVAEQDAQVSPVKAVDSMSEKAKKKVFDPAKTEEEIASNGIAQTDETQSDPTAEVLPQPASSVLGGAPPAQPTNPLPASGQVESPMENSNEPTKVGLETVITADNAMPQEKIESDNLRVREIDSTMEDIRQAQEAIGKLESAMRYLEEMREKAMQNSEVQASQDQPHMPKL